VTEGKGEADMTFCLCRRESVYYAVAVFFHVANQMYCVLLFQESLT